MFALNLRSLFGKAWGTHDIIFSIEENQGPIALESCLGSNSVWCPLGSGGLNPLLQQEDLVAPSTCSTLSQMENQGPIALECSLDSNSVRRPLGSRGLDPPQPDDNYDFRPNRNINQKRRPQEFDAIKRFKFINDDGTSRIIFRSSEYVDTPFEDFRHLNIGRTKILISWCKGTVATRMLSDQKATQYRKVA